MFYSILNNCPIVCLIYLPGLHNLCSVLFAKASHYVNELDQTGPRDVLVDIPTIHNAILSSDIHRNLFELMEPGVDTKGKRI